MTKICTKCKAEKPLADFKKDKKAPDGLAYLCKSCRRISQTEYRKLPEVIVRNLEWENREVNKEKKKQYNSRHDVIEHRKAYRNRPEVVARIRERRASPEMKIYHRIKSREFCAKHKPHLMRRYGLTLEQRNVLESRQNGRCAICDDVIKLYVDHDHATGKVRGLLCRACNSGIAFLKENPDVLERASDYVKTGGFI